MLIVNLLVVATPYTSVACDVLWLLFIVYVLLCTLYKVSTDIFGSLNTVFNSYAYVITCYLHYQSGYTELCQWWSTPLRFGHWPCAVISFAKGRYPVLLIMIYIIVFKSVQLHIIMTRLWAVVVSK